MESTMPAPLPPVDPDVKVPPAVAAAAARAEAIHKQAYAPPVEPQPEPAPTPAPAPQPQPQPAPQPAPPPAPQPAPQPQPPQPEPPAPQPPAPDATYPDKSATLTADQWRHQYLSMKGRYEHAASTIGSMQEQMTELGDELMRTQAMIRGQGQQPQPQPPQPQKLITDEDVKLVGTDVLDIIQRAAREAVSPELQNLHNGVQQVHQQVTRTQQGSVHQLLAAQVPDWVAINRSPRFRQWCSLRDVYSGQVRGNLLNAAFSAGDATRVIAFFKGFLAEEQATGQLPPDPLAQPAPQPARVPAVTLDALTAPGRAKPASGDTQLPADKPIFTRKQIADFYTNVRRGAYAGREADKAADEAAIFAAQNEGRVRN